LPVVMHLPALTMLARVRVRLGDPRAQRLLQQALDEGLPTGEPQRIVPVRLGMAEAAWLAGDAAAGREQLAMLAAMDLEHFNRWDLGELAAWWHHLDMPGPSPVPEARLSRPRLLEARNDPRTAAAEWDRLGLPYEAALALTRVRGS